MKRVVTLMQFLFFSILLFPDSIYIDQRYGDDSNSGKSPDRAFKVFETAVATAVPGDEIIIIGAYVNKSYNPDYRYKDEADSQLWHQENTLKISNLHGLPGNYITIKPYSRDTVLKGDGANIFRVLNSSYLKIEGFIIEGEAKRISLETVKALQFLYRVDNGDILHRDIDITGRVNGEPVYKKLDQNRVTRPSYTDTRGLYLSGVHHIEIINNRITKMPGGGLRVSEGEDIHIKGNEVSYCSLDSYSGTHGLVVTKTVSSRSGDDYRIIIENNRVHHNFNQIYSWSPSKTIITQNIDEGKGISLQRNSQQEGRILVKNNLCYFNGYSGIHSNDGVKIDIIDNICYFNSYTKSIFIKDSGNGGNIGISIQGGGDIKITGNISIIDLNLGRWAISSNLSEGDGLVVEDNIIYGVTLDGVTGPVAKDIHISKVEKNTKMEFPDYDFSSLTP